MQASIKQQEQEILKYLNRLKQGLVHERQRWEKKWEDIRTYGFPYYGDGLSDEDAGDVHDGELVNDYPSECLDTYVAGIQGGTCSPSSKWFKVGIGNPAEDTDHSLSLYLDAINRIILFWLGESNFYESKREQIAELAVFGSAPMLIEEGDVFSAQTLSEAGGDETPFCFTPLSCGTYYLRKNKSGDVDTLVREFSLDAQGMVETFGEDTPEEICRQAEKLELLQSYTVTQVIMPRGKFSLRLPVNTDFRFLSFYYIDGLKNSGIEVQTNYGRIRGGLLRVSGYYEQPFSCPQEKPKRGSSYSAGLGEYVRGNVKGLQMLEDDSYELVEKLADPSMQVPVDDNNNVEIFTEAGSYNPYNPALSQGGITPIYTPSPHAVEAINNKIGILEQRISKRFCVDLFFAVTDKARNIKTAFEASLIDGERFTKLIPTIERLARNDSVLLKRIFSILQRNGWLPSAPENVDGCNIDFTFESPITQTQKLKELPPLEQYLQFLANVAQFEAGAGRAPTAADNLDVDEAIAEYGSVIKVNPKVVRSRDAVAQIRQGREQEAEKLKAEQALAQLPEQAKALAQADMTGGNALSELTSNIMGGGM